MDMPEKTYPLDFSDSDLESRAADLSKFIVEYKSQGGNGEDLIRNSVIFNATYIELQNRKTSRATVQMVRLTWASAAVAFASLIVAWLSFSGGNETEKWQAQQIKLLEKMSNDIAELKTVSQKVGSSPPQTVASVTKPASKGTNPSTRTSP